MKITIKTVAGRAFDMEVSPNLVVQELRKKIATEHQYEYEGLKLVVNGTVAQDEVTVKDTKMDETKFVVMVAKKQSVRAAQQEQRQKEKEREEKAKEKEKEARNVDAPKGPLNSMQLQGMMQLQGLMETKVRTMKDFVEILRFHGTVTEIRRMIQADQSVLRPILYQINHHAPQLLSLINQYQQEFLQIINEPVPKGSNEEADDFEASFMSTGVGHEVVYVTREEEEAIQRLCALGFSHQMAAEAFIVCNRREEIAASYLFEMMEREEQLPVSSERREEEEVLQRPSDLNPPEQAEERREESSDQEALDHPSTIRHGNGTNGDSSAECKEEPATPAAGPPAYAKLQVALVGQGREEEALVVAEQSRFEVDDALHQKMRSLKLSHQKSTGEASSSSSPSVGQYVFDLMDIRRTACDCDATLVYYSTIPHEKLLYVWVVPPSSTDKIAFRQLAIDVEQMEGGIVTLGRSLARNSGINPQSVWKRVLCQLHSLILEPIASLLPSDPNSLVCFVPSEGAMTGLPFAALIAADDSFLITRHTIMTAQSVHALAVAQHFAAVRPSEGCVVCVGPEADTATVKQQINAEHILPNQLSLEAVKQASVLHFASQDIVQTQTELFDANAAAELPIDLAVVATCGDPAAGRKNTTNEDVWKVARALAARGIVTSLLPLWECKAKQDAAAVMQLFYEELLVTHHKARALRQAMLRASNMPNLGIWVWAGWCLTGHAGSLLDTKSGGGETPGVAAAKSPMMKSKPAKKKGKRETRHSEDYRYLKEHRIHVLYEELVREILQHKPNDVPQYVLKYMQEKQVDLQSMMGKDK
jgi:CHAT domain-containing protein|mmetsp:Transcript_93571/g.157247  ORF Transcript_93571/g.157247 Transcript_93571/m.157247 type:complete len:817 (-) Transcript_93571:941-3391(-)|eukprot:CAMPEP_0174297404 /NCGR_PEP_ID=MMETSP0809-20121228/50907_1 /TAXON_ID=73025 ORGANISM="Eutreptiella gymnastica-like, Strain CCMP1594" /NCGR_SAMPLE_ID=MMETSP0809 /ASSEMBLY_ACC=CAM_ASM_000658 /LENGTH=816 /DNA_ID=CAMNT_0015401179 /DNA_START=72 /DNA_END=2522 /DNA_ORIENTATION=+